MPCSADKITSWALGQVGYKEGKNNYTKYGKEYGLNNVPWCAIFVWCDFNANGAADLFYGGKKTASCTTLYNWAKKNGQTVTPSNVRAGDVVFFDWDKSGDCDHVGICVSRSGSTITTVEGNTSRNNAGSQSNGDGVYKRSRAVSLVAKVWRPKYTASSTTTNTEKDGYCNVDLPILRTGSKGAAVKTLQILLNAKGYWCGDTDGDFGTRTANGVKAFQKAQKLSADIIVGPDTWRALLLK